MGLVDFHTAHEEPLGCRSGRVGACGAGAAGSEIQPYLEGGIEEAALSGGDAGLVGPEIQSPTTGDAGSGDPAYRAARGRPARGRRRPCPVRGS